MKVLHLFLLFVLLICSSVNANEYLFDVYGGNIVLERDVSVSKGVSFEPLSVEIKKTLQFTNYGEIDSVFYVCDGCDLYVKNAGIFNANVYMGANSNLIKVVNDSYDLSAFSFDGDFDVLVENTDALSLNAVVDFADGANTIILKNSMLKIDGLINSSGQFFELVGEIKLIADDLSYFYDKPLLTNVFSDGSVRIINNNPDVLYADVVFVKNGSLYVRRIRETDYVKIFKDDTGKFLNMLREINPNDSLFNVLDVAPDMSTLRSEMAQSVRFNSNMLVRPLNVLHVFDRLEFDMAFDSRFDVAPFMIGTDDFYLYGLNLGFNDNVTKRFNVWAGLRVGVLEYSNDLDDYSGQIWGANFGARYVLKNNVFVRGNMLADVMSVDVGHVMYNDKVFVNPRSVSGGAAIDLGYIYNLQNGIFVEPFVGVNADYSRIEGLSDFNTGVIAGVGAGYAYSMFGVRYDYIVRGMALSDDGFGFLGRVGFWSEFDAVGGDVQLSAVHMYDMFSYKLSLNARMWF